jgi:endo-1,4-beta-D-glucanase Y
LIHSRIRRWTKGGALALSVLVTAASGGCRQGPWTLWDAYTSHFIDQQGRVIEHSAGERTTSEGQSYGLFFSLANNDRTRFDRILSWTRDNMAAGDLGKHLPGWVWGKAPDGQWKLLDTNSAADSDCWIAYDLLEAGRLWDNASYSSQGRQMLALIAKQEVADLPGFGSMLMPGPTQLWLHNNAWTLNPSYVPLFLFQRFAEVDPAGPWGAIVMNIPRFLRQSAIHGFAMDWVQYVPGDGFYPAPPPGASQPAAPNSAKTAKSPAESPAATSQKAEDAKAAAAAAEAKAPMGSYDAIRVYLWAGMIDGSGHTRADVFSAVPGMGALFSTTGRSAPPEKVSPQGIPGDADGPVGFSAAVLPYLRAQPALAHASAQQRVRISAQLNPASGLYGAQPVYYDQNLVLFAMGYLDGRFHFGPRGELKVEWTR